MLLSSFREPRPPTRQLQARVRRQGSAPMRLQAPKPTSVSSQASSNRDADQGGGHGDGVQPVGSLGVRQKPRDEPGDSDRSSNRRSIVQTVAPQLLRGGV